MIDQQIIDVVYVSYPPSEDQLAEWRQDWIRKGWAIVSDETEYRTTGYPYVITFRGIPAK